MPTKQSFFKRSGVPALIVTICWVFLHHVHFKNWNIDNDSIRLFIANFSAVLLFITIGLGVSFVYPFSYFRGAGLLERIIASAITPALWTIKEFYRVTEVFTIAESFYYIFNSLFLLLYMFFIGQCGIWELLSRRRLKKTGRVDIKIITLIPILSILLMFVGLWILLIWGGGVYFTYIYVDGYKAIFK